MLVNRTLSELSNYANMVSIWMGQKTALLPHLNLVHQGHCQEEAESLEQLAHCLLGQ